MSTNSNSQGCYDTSVQGLLSMLIIICFQPCLNYFVVVFFIRVQRQLKNFSKPCSHLTWQSLYLSLYWTIIFYFRMVNLFIIHPSYISVLILILFISFTNRAEKLQLLNLKPTTPVEIQLVSFTYKLVLINFTAHDYILPADLLIHQVFSTF